MVAMTSAMRRWFHGQDWRLHGHQDQQRAEGETSAACPQKIHSVMTAAEAANALRMFIEFS